MSNEVLIKTNEIVKHFGLTHALNGISIEVRRGEIVGLIGENGSGKSTLSSIISGIYPPTSGSLELKGNPYKPADAVDAQKHGISMITQKMGTLSGIRVADNIFLGKEEFFARKGIVNRKKMYEAASEEFEENRIKELMVGRKLTGDYYRSDYDGSYGKNVVLKADRIYAGHILQDISLELHKGEILGIGGLTDCGMHDLGKVLFGMEKPLYGSVTLGDGKEITNAKEAISNRIGYVSKNRDQEALILSASILDNTVLPSLNRIMHTGLIFRKDEKNLTNKQVEDLNIKCRETEQDVRDLSGGNKQKVVFGKWLGNESEIFILDCPTRGIDIGVKAFMYQLMYRLKKEGKSIIMISEELPELIGMSDRIMIMKDGKIRKTFNRSEELNESVLIKEMV